MGSGVLGLSDPEGGEYCAALVVLEEDVELDMEEVRDWANRQLRLSANLREVRKVHTLPVNNVGKKVRRSLKELWKSPSAKIKTIAAFMNIREKAQDKDSDSDVDFVGSD